jgi:hypothetical protein
MYLYLYNLTSLVVYIVILFALQLIFIFNLRVVCSLKLLCNMYDEGYVLNYILCFNLLWRHNKVMLGELEIHGIGVSP